MAKEGPGELINCHGDKIPVFAIFVITRCMHKALQVIRGQSVQILYNECSNSGTCPSSGDFRFSATNCVEHILQCMQIHRIQCK